MSTLLIDPGVPEPPEWLDKDVSDELQRPTPLLLHAEILTESARAVLSSCGEIVGYLARLSRECNERDLKASGKRGLYS